MPLKVFTADSLGLLQSGRVIAMINAHLARCSADCADRPNDVTKRTVTIKIDLVPIAEGDGTCDRVEAQFHATSSLPPWRTSPVSLGMRQNGMLLWNPDSPGNVNQATFAREDEE